MPNSSPDLACVDAGLSKQEDVTQHFSLCNTDTARFITFRIVKCNGLSDKINITPIESDRKTSKELDS